MEPTIVTMDRRNRNYLNPSFPSGSKLHSLPHRQLKAFKKHHHSHLPSPLRSRTSSSTSHNHLPTTTKTKKKMAETATKKRARPDEPWCDPDYGKSRHQTSMACDSNHLTDTTSLELGEGPTTKKRKTEVSNSAIEKYKRRLRSSSPAEMIRKKRALVLSITKWFLDYC